MDADETNRTLEDFARLITLKGLKINNLFQYDSGTWVCSLRSATHGYAFGSGGSWRVAAILAYDAYERGDGEPLLKQNSRAKIESMKSITLEDLLGTPDGEMEGELSDID